MLTFNKCALASADCESVLASEANARLLFPREQLPHDIDALGAIALGTGAFCGDGEVDDFLQNGLAESVLISEAPTECLTPELRGRQMPFPFET
ncbi:MAG: hypothetical protein KA152_16235 [Verrucomicrobiales bacterium]|nr:hypothetical protein [Verrucomicrobiales bacterium]